MKFFRERHHVLFIFGILAFTMLFVFQNCSSSLFTLASSQQASAKSKTDFSDMINESESEIRDTKNEMTAKEQSFSFADKNTIRVVATQPEAQTVSMNLPMKIKLKRAPAAKRKRSPALKTSQRKKSKVKLKSKVKSKSKLKKKSALKKKTKSKVSSKSKLKTKKKKKPYHIED